MCQQKFETQLFINMKKNIYELDADLDKLIKDLENSSDDDEESLQLEASNRFISKVQHQLNSGYTAMVEQTKKTSLFEQKLKLQSLLTESEMKLKAQLHDIKMAAFDDVARDNQDQVNEIFSKYNQKQFNTMQRDIDRRKEIRLEEAKKEERRQMERAFDRELELEMKKRQAQHKVKAVDLITKEMVRKHQYELLGIPVEKEDADISNNDYEKAMRLIELERVFPKPDNHPFVKQASANSGIINSGFLPRDLWLTFILPCLGTESLLRMEKTGRFFYYSINNCPSCEHEGVYKTLMRADLSPVCKSLYTKVAALTGFTHKNFDHVCCRIVKMLMARQICREKVNQVLPLLYQKLCKNDGLHVFQKPTKKTLAMKCSICQKGTPSKDICGYKSRKCCLLHKNQLCIYPSSSDKHKCYCHLCSKMVAAKLNFYLKVLPELDLAKSQLDDKHREAFFKIDY